MVLVLICIVFSSICGFYISLIADSLTKGISILLLICYGFLLSGSILAVGHELLHATASITGLHQHEVQHQHTHGVHSHHHHISDHNTFFEDAFTFSDEGKNVFLNMVFVAFYFEPTLQLTLGKFYFQVHNYFFLSSLFKQLSPSPTSPPPDYLY